MIKGGQGGANTTTGLIFEGKTDLATFLDQQKNIELLKGIIINLITYIMMKNW